MAWKGRNCRRCRAPVRTDDALCNSCSFLALSSLDAPLETMKLVGPVQVLMVRGAFAGVAVVTSVLDEAGDNRMQAQFSMLVSVATWVSDRVLRLPAGGAA